MLELNFDPFPNLQTERLALRQVSMDDAASLYELRSNKDAMKYIGRELPKSIEDIHDLITKMMDLSERIQWAITIKNEDKLIGTIGYHIIEKPHYRAELGYMLHPDHWSKGLMSEAIAAVVSYGFEGIGLHSIEARITPTNLASAAILRKHSFEKEGYFKESFFFNGEFFDSAVYSLLRQPKPDSKTAFHGS